jgi:predicted RNase H-like HicB family nuclease
MEEKPIDRPFTKEIWNHACDLARDYHIVVEENDALGHVAYGLEFPLVFADGKDVNKCKDEWREALRIAIATMLEIGRKLPPLQDPRPEEYREEDVLKTIAGMRLFTKDLEIFYIHNEFWIW